MRSRLSVWLATAALALGAASAVPSAQSTVWLDRPLQNWNKAGGTVPRGPADRSDHDDAIERCKSKPPQTAGGRAVTSAGWVPQLYNDRELINGDIEIVGAVSGLDGMCAPVDYNVFVFVGGVYAGALSPILMKPGTDASGGVVRFVDDGVTVEFARYKPGDATCCPTSRVAVRYRIDRSGDRAVVVPVDVRTTRSY
jgi:hypothetical protein